MVWLFPCVPNSQFLPICAHAWHNFWPCSPNGPTCRLSGLQHLVLWGSEVGDQGMRELEHLSQLTVLDLSLTQCSSPPLLPTLRHLSMVHCQLDVVGEDREALWLDMG